MIKSLRKLRLEWRHISPHKKNLIVVALFAFVIGTILIVIGFSVIFGYIKPYKNWQYYECLNRNEDFFELGNSRVKIIYVVDDEVYEKQCTISTRRLFTVRFWYNADNPDEIIFCKDGYMIIMPIFITVGVVLYTVGGAVCYKCKKIE